MLRRWGAAATVGAAVVLTGACAVQPRENLLPQGREIADVARLPQKIGPYVAAAGERLAIGAACRGALLEEFRARYFAPWTEAGPQYDPAEAKEEMRKTALKTWYGANRQVVAPELLRDILDNCALESFPSRSVTAIAVAPSHMRGLPTRLPLFATQDSYPFDALQYPNVKLNEPLRILHASKDGIWLYVESAYSAGWLKARDVAPADRSFIDAWMARPQLVIVRDYATVAVGKWETGFRAKIGTLLPLVAAGDGWWDAAVATAGEGRGAVCTLARLPRGAAARFPLPFDRENVTMIGDQLMGQPYGWGEMYGLRDCSATLRDFFLPFGIWLPRTAADQIDSTGKRRDLSGLTPREKEEAVRQEGVPFLTLYFKPGHIMLYVGTDQEGRPLVFHNAWAVRVQGGAGEREHVIGKAVVTTLEPGKELGVAKGATLLEQGTALATITDRCERAPAAARSSHIDNERSSEGKYKHGVNVLSSHAF